MSSRPSGLILNTCHMSCNCYLKYCSYHNLMPSIWLDIENLWLSAKQLIKCMMGIWPCQMIFSMLISHRLGWSTYLRLLLIFMYFAHPNNNSNYYWSVINMNIEELDAQNGLFFTHIIQLTFTCVLLRFCT